MATSKSYTNIEQSRKLAEILPLESADMKWYFWKSEILDCECNDNCKDSKCFFHNEYERYLKGETNALPPKFTNRILNEDGGTSDDWRYRHFMSKMQDAFIEKAEEFIYSALNDGIMGTANIEDFMKLFKKYMKGK